MWQSKSGEKEMTTISKLLALVLGVALMCESGAEERVSVELAMPQVASLDDHVPMSLVFTNSGDEAFFFHFSGVDYGQRALVVCAQKDSVWYATGKVHFDRDVSATRFDFIPLRPDQKFETPVLGINDLNAVMMPALRLPEPGEYEVFASYTSEGPGAVGILWPVWRGRLKSEPKKLRLTAAADEVVGARLAALRQCVSEGCDTNEIAYFTIGRVSAAVPLLADLLDRAVAPDPVLIEALVNQSHDAADTALMRFVRRFPREAALVRELRERHEEAAKLCAGR